MPGSERERPAGRAEEHTVGGVVGDGDGKRLRRAERFVTWIELDWLRPEPLETAPNDWLTGSSAGFGRLAAETSSRPAPTISASSVTLPVSGWRSTPCCAVLTIAERTSAALQRVDAADDRRRTREVRRRHRRSPKNAQHGGAEHSGRDRAEHVRTRCRDVGLDQQVAVRRAPAAEAGHQVRVLGCWTSALRHEGRGRAVVVVDRRAVREADHDTRDGRLRLEPVVGHDERRLFDPVDHDHADRAGVLGVAHLHGEVADSPAEQRDRTGEIGQRRAVVAGEVQPVVEPARGIRHDLERSGHVAVSSAKSPMTAS